MYKKSMNISVAAGLSIIGAFVAFIAAFLVFDAQGDDILLSIGLLLLVAVLFLGIAGGLSEDGQWSWGVMMFMIFICAAVVVVAYIYDAIGLDFAAVLAAIALVVAVLTSAGSVKATLG